MFFKRLSESQAINAVAPLGDIYLVDTFPYTPPEGRTIKAIYIPDGTDISLINSDGSTVTLTGWSYGRLDINPKEITSSTNPLYVVLD